MSRHTIRSTASEGDLSALGAFDPATRRLVALIGRHEGCALASWCRTGWVDHGVPPTSPTGDNPVPPADVEVTLTLPWTTRVPSSISVTRHSNRESQLRARNQRTSPD